MFLITSSSIVISKETISTLASASFLAVSSFKSPVCALIIKFVSFFTFLIVSKKSNNGTDPSRSLPPEIKAPIPFSL